MSFRENREVNGSLAATRVTVLYRLGMRLSRRTESGPPMSMQKFLLAGLLLYPVSPATADRFDNLWLEGHQWLEPAGITKPMFRSLTIWSDGQYFLGYCGAYLSDGDVDLWRNWWTKTIVPHSEVGRQLLKKGAALYARGLNDGKSAPPLKEFCRRVLDGWSKDMAAANVKDQAR